MKRIAALTLLLATVLCLLSTAAFAANASASLTGPDTVRAGDTITLTFNLNGAGLLGGSGTLSYETSKLTLTNTKQVVAALWAVEFNGNNVVYYDNNLTNPIQKDTALFTATFKVNGSLAVGTTITVSVTDVVASDGSADSNIGTVTYSKTIAPPMSTDNALKSLSVSNATISPAFSPDTTSYTAEVPFEVSKLDVSAVANDSTAKVTVSSPNLAVNGTTKVTVTVKAENGSTKTYTITVKRAQDPNYVPSGSNDLSSITVDGFLLSPGFSEEVTSYVVWLPYETESIQISGVASDGKASVEVVGGDNLEAGKDNEIKVICTAENGEKKEYTIIAKRAAAHGSDPVIPGPTEPSNPVTPSEPTVPSTPTQPTDPEEPTTPSVPNDPTDPTVPAQPQPDATKPQQNPGDEQPSGGIPVVVLVIVSVACLAVGAVTGFIIGKKKQ